MAFLRCCGFALLFALVLQRVPAGAAHTSRKLLDGSAPACLLGPYLFSSYWDKSGQDAPDGNYKETCQNIIYDCTTDIISAVCGNNKPNVPTAEQYNSSTLPGASSCPGNIANAWGILQCQGVSDNSPSSSSADPTCGNTYLYVSQLDNSGGDAPDGNYKETCKDLVYDCKTDELSAGCGNGLQGSAHAYPYSSLVHASYCTGNLANEGGVLTCTPKAF